MPHVGYGLNTIFEHLHDSGVSWGYYSHDRVFAFLRVFGLRVPAFLVSPLVPQGAVDSTPLDARVEVDGSERCVTMCTLELERRRSHRVVVALNGYAPETTAVRRSTQTRWLAADLTLGLVIGLVVDRLTGRLFELHPDDINASLKRR